MPPQRFVVLGALVFAAGCGAEAVGPAASAPESGRPTAAADAPAARTATSARVTAMTGGKSCDAARAEWADAAAARGADAPEPPPEHDAEIKNTLNHGKYLNDCSVPESADVAICAAIVDGQVRGATVVIEGGTQEQADCVAEAVGKMPFPPHETMSISKTRFAPTK
jgi:hypothetical protein